MKQTAVEWLEDALKSKYGLFTSLYPEFEQAKEMEKEQMTSYIVTTNYEANVDLSALNNPQMIFGEHQIQMLEISDEDIKEKMFGGQFDDQDDDDLSMFFGAKWYREQLKQRQ